MTDNKRFKLGYVCGDFGLIYNDEWIDLHSMSENSEKNVQICINKMNELAEENELIKQENNELKNKLAKVEEILNNRLSNDFRPVHSDGRTELFIEEKAGYRKALKQLKKKLIRENIIEGDMND